MAVQNDSVAQGLRWETGAEEAGGWLEREAEASPRNTPPRPPRRRRHARLLRLRQQRQRALAARATGASKVLGWPKKMQVGPCIPVGTQLSKAEVGPTSGPAWRLSHLGGMLP